ncbi:hypothetical protein BH11PLA1_BH11PLA1_10610 [soil metagenome]
MTASARGLLAAALLSVVSVTDVAPAQSLPAAAGSVISRADLGMRSPHGWAVIPATGSAPGSDARPRTPRGAGTLVHLPPRDGMGRSGPGTVRRVMDLAALPEALGADGARVYLAGHPEVIFAGGARHRQRRVVSLGAASMTAGLWEFGPPGGRVEAALPGDGELVDLIAGPAGMLALLAPVAGEEDARWRLLVLEVDGWKEVEWPAGANVGAARWVRLVGGPRALVMIEMGNGGGARGDIVRAGHLEEWIIVPVPVVANDGAGGAGADGEDEAAVARRAAAEAARDAKAGVMLRATGRRFALPDGVAGASLRMMEMGGRMLAAGRVAGAPTDAQTPDALALWELGAQRAREIWRDGGAPSAPETRSADLGRADAAALFLSGVDRLVLLEPSAAGGSSSGAAGGAASDKAADADASAGAPNRDGERGGGGGGGGTSLLPIAAPRMLPRREIVVREISTSTGEVLFAQAAKNEGPITARDFQLMALALGALTATVLVFVLRGDNTHAVILPRGTSLATPTRRMCAAILDLAPAYVLAAALTGRTFARLALLGNIEGLTAALTLSAVTLGIAMAHCTLGEWLTGRSLGKMFFGCVVIPARVRRGKGAKGDAGYHGPRREDDDADAGVVEGRAQEDDTAAARLGPGAVALEEQWALGPRGPRGAGAAGPGGAGEEAEPLPSITLRQALLRNILRWTPPLAGLILVDPNFRHPGDVVAGTVVVIQD